MSAKKSLNRNQKKAISALMRNKTISEAAAACGLSDKTLQRYLADPDFRRAINQEESNVIDEAGLRLVSGQPLALDTLENLMLDGMSETTRRLAAVSWMDFVLRWRELRTIEERLLALEERVFDGRK